MAQIVVVKGIVPFTCQGVILLRKLLSVTLLLALAAAVFYQVQRGGLIWQDPESLTSAGIELGSQGDAQAQTLKQLWQPELHHRFAPVPATVWQGVARLSGSKDLDTKLHTLSLGVHLFNVILLFFLLNTFVQSEWAAFLASALFAVHPIQTEAVAYLSAFAILLGGTFSLLAISQFVHHALALRHGHKSSKGRRFYWFGTLCLILAVLCHPAYVVIPGVAATMLRLLPKQTTLYVAKPSSWRIGLWWAIVVPAAVWEIFSQETESLRQLLPFWSRLVVSGDTLVFYMAKFLMPINIGPDYGRSPMTVMTHWWSYVLWLLPVGLYLLAAPRRGSQQSWYQAAVVIFVTLLLPVSGLVYFSAQANSTVANQYAYLALMAPALGLAFFISKSRRAFASLVIVGLIGTCAWLSKRDISQWRSDDSLWPFALNVSPGSPIAHLMLGNRAFKAGDSSAAREHYRAALSSHLIDASVYSNLADIERLQGTPEQAAAYYTKALQLNPGLRGVHRYLGEVHLAKGAKDKALVEFQEAVKENPKDFESLRQLGILFAHNQQFDLAIPYLTQVVDQGQKSPETAEAQALLGKALFNTNQPDLALNHLRQALEIFPNHGEANRQLGDIYFAKGLLNESKTCYERVLTYGQPSFEVYKNLGVIHTGRKEHAKAMSYLSSALTLKKNDAEILKNIGVSQFNLRQYREAQQSFNRALGINPNLAEPYYYLGDMARWQRKDADAIRFYQAAIKNDPTFGDAYYRLGNLYMKREQVADALALFQVGLKNIPNDPKLTYALRQASQPKQKDKVEI
ncbi:MAG: tetratricopeptide repeat protein [Deltaproteobacteria bacterium]|nr:tetratricopeptide repeat protein [Deltaproteobacteria bacterium]